MKKQVDKSKITIVIMSIVFALSLSVTITLAAFSANKTGDVTLTFADGLTMQLDPLNFEEGYLTITSASVSDTTFSYTIPQSNNAAVRLDGVKATVNKQCWIAFKVEIKEVISGSRVTPSGNWARYGNTFAAYYATGEKSDWKMQMQILDTYFTYGAGVFDGSGVIVTSKDLIPSNKLQNLIIFRFVKLMGVAQEDYVNDLAGRNFEIYITIKAQTDQAPTFS